MSRPPPIRPVWLAILLASTLLSTAAETYRVASYNLNNYFLDPGGSRPRKSLESQKQIEHNIAQIRPDILAVQEMSDEGALIHLKSRLNQEGLQLRYHEIITGWDTNIRVAVLSRFPIAARRPHTNDHFLLNGRRFQVSRGFLEVDIQIAPDYMLTLFNAHLKSKRQIPEADEADLRLEEARMLRSKIDLRLSQNPNANIVVLGDFNDTKNASPIKTILGRGRTKLIDTRPAEANGDTTPPLRSGYDPPNITWTYFYGLEDSYSRVDYIMISAGLAREWPKEETFVLATPNWGLASDHRPIVATFEAKDR